MGCHPSRKSIESVVSVDAPPQTGLAAYNLIHANPKNFLSEYTVQHSLGSGSYGEVRLVTHKLTNQERAVKLFAKSPEDYKSYLKVKTEIEILKSLHHPSIIKIFEYFEDEKRLYIILEKCNGGELFDMITKNNRLNENISALVCQQIFSALAYMHENQVIHRDLKPENILLEENEDFVNIKLIDFGTAMRVTEGKRFSEVIGSPFYMAPEVIAKDYSVECDMWSCGVILYILLSGTPPFDGKNNQEILNKVSKGEYSFTKPIWNEVSEPAKDLIKKLLCPESSRLTATMALLHPWIKSLGRIPHQNSSSMLTLKANLQQFHSRSKLHTAVTAFISNQIVSTKETKVLRELFKAIDTNGDGKLSKEELIKGFDEYDIEFASSIMAKIDADQNGFIDLDEFLLAAIDQKTLLSRENVKKAFDMIDLDCSGKVSINELQSVLGVGLATGKTIWQDISNLHKSSEDELDFHNFCEILGSYSE